MSTYGLELTLINFIGLIIITFIVGWILIKYNENKEEGFE